MVWHRTYFLVLFIFIYKSSSSTLTSCFLFLQRSILSIVNPLCTSVNVMLGHLNSRKVNVLNLLSFEATLVLILMLKCVNYGRSFWMHVFDVMMGHLVIFFIVFQWKEMPFGFFSAALCLVAFILGNICIHPACECI